MSLLLRLEVDAEPMYLGLIRHAVETWLTAAGWPGAGTESLVFAVSEVVSNSIEHAYPGLSVGRVRVEIARERAGPGRSRAIVVVSDDGQWRPEADDTRGNGLALIAAMTDGVVVTTGDAGTRVTITSTVDDEHPMPA